MAESPWRWRRPARHISKQSSNKDSSNGLLNWSLRHAASCTRTHCRHHGKRGEQPASVFLVGIVVFRGISTVATPPRVSTPSDRGVTSSRTMSFTSPARTPACTAAPTATTSSGFTLWLGFLPPTSSEARDWMEGIRVEPPTSTISLISLALILESFKAFSTGVLHAATAQHTDRMIVVIASFDI